MIPADVELQSMGCVALFCGSALGPLRTNGKVRTAQTLRCPPQP